MVDCKKSFHGLPPHRYYIYVVQLQLGCNMILQPNFCVHLSCFFMS
jgi:hypothetical protein